MKAIIWTKYGPPDVLQLAEIEKPVPKDNEVLIRVYATTVVAADCELRALRGPLFLTLAMRVYVGFSKPQRITILGQELAGEIESVGKEVTRFRPGDQVFAWTGLRLSANAEYACLRESGVLAIKPANMSYEEATTIPLGGLEALHFLRKANIQPGEKVLINGAGGSIGTIGVQLAKYYGAEVTAVDSAGKLDMLRSIGADHVIDYAREDFTRSTEAYDAIFDVAGKSSFSRSMKALKPNGRYLLGNPRMSDRLRGRWNSGSHGKRVVFGATEQRAADLVSLRGLIEAGKIKSVIDKRYALEEIVEAHRYVETGQKKGNVVITVGPGEKT
jgi:NADPH:quinone reductase-like Zn-dependent oxidoreductase